MQGFAEKDEQGRFRLVDGPHEPVAPKPRRFPAPVHERFPVDQYLGLLEILAAKKVANSLASNYRCLLTQSQIFAKVYRCSPFQNMESAAPVIDLLEKAGVIVRVDDEPKNRSVRFAVAPVITHPNAVALLTEALQAMTPDAANHRNYKQSSG